MSHRRDFVPLLPSGPRGVQKFPVAWDLTSNNPIQHTFDPEFSGGDPREDGLGLSA